MLELSRADCTCYIIKQLEAVLIIDQKKFRCTYYFSHRLNINLSAFNLQNIFNASKFSQEIFSTCI